MENPEHPITTNIKEQCREKQLSTSKLVDLQTGKSNIFFRKDKDEPIRKYSTDKDIFKLMAKYDQLVKVILVEGGSGMGKTMFCISLLKDWADGKDFEEYKVLLFLEFHKREIASACSLPELIESLELVGDPLDIVSFIQENNGDRVMIIADGWNELSVPNRLESSFFYNLLFGDLLSRASVIVTSRPTASAVFHTDKCPVVDRFIELHGFNQEGIEGFVRSKLTELSANGLLEQIKSNPILQSMCSVPLICEQVCHLWRISNGALPSGMTDLCTKVILSILSYNCQKVGAPVDISSLAEIDNLPTSLRESWWCLCKIAFQSLDKSEVDRSQFTSYQDGIMTFGLVEYGASEEDSDELLVNFPHPTSQEYLAALHAAKMPLDSMFPVFQLKSKSTEFWRYFFGLCASIEGSEKILKHAVNLISKCTSPQLLLCHCAFEIKNYAITKEVIKCLGTQESGPETVTHVHFGDPKNGSDCDAVLYVIASMKGSECNRLQLEVNFSACNLSIKQVSTLADVLASGKVQVKDLDLSENNLPDERIVELFQNASASFQFLERLIINKNDIGVMGISAITKALVSGSLTVLDLSFNRLSLEGLHILQNAIKSDTLENLEVLFMQGCLTSNESDNIEYLSGFAGDLLRHCLHIRRLDLSNNTLGDFITPAVRNIIKQLTSKRIDLRLNDTYMSEVDKNFVQDMENLLKKKGAIEHTIVHGVFVGPGRSGKNSLMNRLIGEGPLDPDTISPSTGVLENVKKVEVMNVRTVAVNNLRWRMLKYDEEALELMMTTVRSHTPSRSTSVEKSKGDVKKDTSTGISRPLEERESKTNPPKPLDTLTSDCKPNQEEKASTGHTVLNSEVRKKRVPTISSEQPLDIFKRAVKLRRMDALREHLESSWTLYLSNAGGQVDFQEVLPVLVCGPSVFFITFPLNQPLNEKYPVDYQYRDGQHVTYPSPSTLMEEILQTLATIASLDCTGPYNSSEVSLKPKVFLVGTHKDKLLESTSNADAAIKEIDKKLQDRVKNTSLYRQSSVEFAEGTEQLIFTVNNLDKADSDFQKIRSALQRAIKRRKEFTIKCPSTWLIFSLILRAKQESDSCKVLSYTDCFTIAQRCGISDGHELNEALIFIHNRLGLIRYFCYEKLNKLVIIDPQIIFDTITKFILETFESNDHATPDEIECFKKQGLISKRVIEEIIEHMCLHNNSQLFLKWIIHLLDHLKIAALFMYNGEKFYFLPAALYHAPDLEQQVPHCRNNHASLIKHEPPPLLIEFEGGFCPRWTPGAIITHLMSNEMDSSISWKLRSNRVYRNQVTFNVGPCDITIRISPTHLEVKLDPESVLSDFNEDDIRQTCQKTYTQLKEAMMIVTRGYRKCNSYFACYCTLPECRGNPHPAQLELDNKMLDCKIKQRQACLPQNVDMWIPQENYIQQVDDKHFGALSDIMYEWEGRIADELKLSPVDVTDIKMKHPQDIRLQTRRALFVWKQNVGDKATYSKLIDSFKKAGYQTFADYVKNLALTCQNAHTVRGDTRGPLSSQTSVSSSPSQQPVAPTIDLVHQQQEHRQPTFEEVLDVLKDVVNWKDVAANLGFTSPIIKALQQYPIDQQKQEMIIWWLNSDKHASIGNLKRALANCQNRMFDSVQVSIVCLDKAKIRKHFSDLLVDLDEALSLQSVQEQINTDEVHNYLMVICPTVPKGSLSDMFKYVTSKNGWDFLHYSPLEDFVRHFLPHKGEQMTKYKQDMLHFCFTTRLVDYIQSSHISVEDEGQDIVTWTCGDVNTEHHHKLIVEVILKVYGMLDFEPNVHHVYDLWKKIAQEFDVPQLTAIIHNIDLVSKDRFSVTWLALPDVAKSIDVAMSNEKSIPFFLQHEIMHVAINGQLIFDAMRYLLEIASHGAWQRMKDVLQRHGWLFDLNLSYCDGKSPLIIAAELGVELMILTLLDNGADVSFKHESTGRTALFFAAENGHEDATAILLAYGADPRQKDSAGIAALDVAIKKARGEFQPYVSKSAKRLTVRSISTQQRVVEAVEGMKHTMFKQMFGSIPTDLIGATRSDDTEAVEYILMNTKDDSAIRELIKARENDKHGWTALMYASDKGNARIAEQLLARGANPDESAKSNGWTCLMLASRRGSLQVTKMLLDRGADPNLANNEDVSPLSIALYERRTAVPLLLIHRGADVHFPDQHGWTPLIRASNEGNLKLVKIIADLGANLNDQTNEGWSSLMVSSNYGHIGVVKELAKRGAELNLATRAGDTALHLATLRNRAEVVEELAKLGADLNAGNKDGLTALMVAANKNYVGVANALLEEGADPNQPHQETKWTALFFAAKNGHVEIVKNLLFHKSKTELLNEDGSTKLSVLDVASNLKQMAILSALGTSVDYTPSLASRETMDIENNVKSLDSLTRALEHRFRSLTKELS